MGEESFTILHLAAQKQPTAAGPLRFASGMLRECRLGQSRRGSRRPRKSKDFERGKIVSRIYLHIFLLYPTRIVISRISDDPPAIYNSFPKQLNARPGLDTANEFIL